MKKCIIGNIYSKKYLLLCPKWQNLNMRNDPASGYLRVSAVICPLLHEWKIKWSNYTDVQLGNL